MIRIGKIFVITFLLSFITSPSFSANIGDYAKLKEGYFIAAKVITNAIENNWD